jgi:hypothetical protein
MGRSSFDFILGTNKLYNPVEGDTFIRPNGLSLRPLGGSLAELIETFNSKYFYEIPKDVVIPDNFVLIHEHSDHYSLQTK